MESLAAAHAWLIAGAVLLAIEVFGVPGIGFLFAGIAALIVGMLVQVGIIGELSTAAQFAWFFSLTAISAALLWKKLKTWRSGSGARDSYDNIIGDEAMVGAGGLTKGKVGQVSWSGTTMMAELAEDAPPSVAAGSVVLVKAVKGNKLIVSPGN